MDTPKTKWNTSEVSRRTGKGRATIARHAKAGKISYELDENGHMLFDASEISRAYPNDIQQMAPKKGKNSADQEGSSLALKIAHDKLIGQYETRIAHLEKVLDKALDITPLLADQSAEKDNWEALLEARTKEMANETRSQIAQLDKKHQEEANKWKRRYLREAKKTWWDKLFPKKRAGTGEGN